MDAKVTEIEFSSEMKPETKANTLKKLRQEMKDRSPQLDAVADASLNLIERSEILDAQLIEDMAQKFLDLRTDVTARLNRMDSVPPVQVVEEAMLMAASASVALARPQSEDPTSVNTAIQASPFSPWLQAFLR